MSRARPVKGSRPFTETRLGPSASTKPSEPSANSSQPATNRRRPLGQLPTRYPGRDKLSQGEGWPGGPVQKAKKLETEGFQNRRGNAQPTTTLLRRPARSSFAGHHVSGPARSRRSYAFSEVPAERRSSQASTTRLAMPPSATFPQARGSYAFLFPTSPSTFSTPS